MTARTTARRLSLLRPPFDGASRGLKRTLVSLALALASGILGFTAAMGLTHSLLAAGLIGLAVAALLGWRSYGYPVVALDEGACSPGLKVLAAISALVALLVVARLTVYIVDPAQVSFSLIPASDWGVRHSCVSAYVVAGDAIATQPNVYDDALYTAPNDDPTPIRKALMLGTFKIDVFEYPPQFLLLPRGLLLLAPAFLDQRMLWFALEGGVILLALLFVARFIGPTAGTRALLRSADCSSGSRRSAGSIRASSVSTFWPGANGEPRRGRRRWVSHCPCSP